MDQEQQAAADARFEAAREQTGARDPRQFYRERLRELKATDATAYRSAVTYYEEELIPAIAGGSADPLAAWMEYGRRIAELTVEGRTVTIDPTGRSEDYRAPADLDRLVLHLPQGGRGRALAVGLPPALSAAQQATFDLLVGGRKKLKDRSVTDT